VVEVVVAVVEVVVVELSEDESFLLCEKESMLSVRRRFLSLSEDGVSFPGEESSS